MASHVDALSRHIALSGLDVLDVGAGEGAFVSALSQKGAGAVGVEIDEIKVARAKEVSARDIRLGFAQKLPFDGDSFDLR